MNAAAGQQAHPRNFYLDGEQTSDRFSLFSSARLILALASASATVRAYSLEKSRRVGRVPRLFGERRHLEHASTTDCTMASLFPLRRTRRQIETDRRVYALPLSLYCEIHRVGVLGELFSNVCNLLAEQ